MDFKKDALEPIIPQSPASQSETPWEKGPLVSAPKVRKVFLFSLLALGIVILFVQLGKKFFPQYTGLIAGSALLLLAIPFHLAGRKKYGFYLVSFFLTSAANGCIVSVYYIICRVPIHMVEMMLACIPVIAMILIACILGNSSFRFSLPLIVVLQVLLLLGTGYLWLAVNPSIFSFSFFGLLFSCFYISILANSMKHRYRSLWRDISYGGFGIFIVFSLVVLFVISDGDGLDGFEIPLFEGGVSKKKQKK